MSGESAGQARRRTDSVTSRRRKVRPQRKDVKADDDESENTEIDFGSDTLNRINKVRGDKRWHEFSVERDDIRMISGLDRGDTGHADDQKERVGSMGQGHTGAGDVGNCKIVRIVDQQADMPDIDHFDARPFLSSSVYRAVLEVTEKEMQTNTDSRLFRSVKRIAGVAGACMLGKGLANYFLGS